MLPYLVSLMSVLRLKRVCPKCGRGQIVKPSRKDDTVSCKFCKTQIPPPRKKG